MEKKQSFYEVVMSDKPTLVDFHATWCGPCKMMAPILKDVSKNMGDKVKVIKIDIDKNTQLANKLNVKSVPTLVIYQRGQIVWRKSGVQTAVQLEKALNPFIQNS